jgi:hypothetical protein
MKGAGRKESATPNKMDALILLSGVSLFLFFLALSEDQNLPRRH